MGIFSTMGAMFGPAGVAIGAGADMFLSSGSEGGGGGGVGATSRQVRPEVAATFAEMGSLSAEFTARMRDERARKAKTPRLKWWLIYLAQKMTENPDLKNILKD